jgi:uncharacterized protein (TIGR02266 family)
MFMSTPRVPEEPWEERTTTLIGRPLSRAELQVDVSLTSGQHVHSGRIRDIGVGGLFVATEDILLVGEQIKLTFALPGVDPFDAIAEVRWVRAPWATVESSLPPGMGLRFLRIPPHAQEVIQAFLRSREPAPDQER